MKRSFLNRTLFFCTALLLLAVLVMAGTAAPKRYDGTKIRIITFDFAAASEAIKKEIATIKKKTGVEVIVETFPVPNLYEKMAMDASTKAGQWDLYMYDNAWGPQFIKAGWVINLDKYIKRDAKAVGLEDFMQANLRAFQDAKRRTFGLPWYADVQDVFYRKDWLANPDYQAKFKKMFGRDLTVPTNIEEFVEVAKFFTKKYNPDSPTEYGTVDGRMRDLCGFCAFLEILYSLGGDVIYGQPPESLNRLKYTAKQKHHSALSTPIGYEAARIYKWLSSPELGIMLPGSATYSWWEVTGPFQTSKVALTTMWSTVAPVVEDPATGNATGKIGYAPGLIYHGIFDKKVKGGFRSGRIGGWGIGISSMSKNKDAAWEVVKHLCGIENARHMLIDNKLEVPRNSTYNDPELQKQYPSFKATVISMATARPVPQYPFYEKIELIMTKYLSELAAKADADPVKYMDNATAEINELMKKQGMFK